MADKVKSKLEFPEEIFFDRITGHLMVKKVV